MHEGRTHCAFDSKRIGVCEDGRCSEAYPLIQRVASRAGDGAVDPSEPEPFCSELFGALTTAGGWVVTIASLPLAGCGLGPVVRVPRGHEGMLMRFGRFETRLPAGMHHYNPCSEEVIVVDMRVRTLDIERQCTVTSDDMPVEVGLVVCYRIEDCVRARLDVRDCVAVLSGVARCRLHETSCRTALDELMHHTSEVNEKLTERVAEAVREWGIGVISVDIVTIALRESVQRAVANGKEEEDEDGYRGRNCSA
jgi:regulator of protease activity HflC (stomatin/prohibitin superfamily)